MKLNKSPAPAHIVAVIDNSGSMHSLVDDSIGGYNAFLEVQKKLPGEARISTLLFNDNVKFMCDDVDVREAPKLTKTTYKVGGMTALNDAIGMALTRLLEANPEKAIVCILTDGQENSSRKFKHEDVKQLISKAKDKGWEVHYLAANQDAFAVGSGYGIVNNVNFSADSAGVMRAYNNVTASTSLYRGG